MACVEVRTSSFLTTAAASPALNAADSSHSSHITSPAHASASPIIREMLHIFHTTHSRISASWSESWSWTMTMVPFTRVGTTPTSARSTADDGSDGYAEGTLVTTFLPALLAYGAGAMVWILSDFKDTAGGWSPAPKVAYGVAALLTTALLAVGFITAFGCRLPACDVGRLCVCAFCSRLAAIASTALLVVSLSCKLGRRGCVDAGVPSAAVVSGAMAAAWIWGDERAVSAFCLRALQQCCGRRAVAEAAHVHPDLDLELAQGGGGMS